MLKQNVITHNESQKQSIAEHGVLDMSNPNYLTYHKDHIIIEIIGGINDIVHQSLKVTLKVYKEGASNPMHIYRSSQIDLFNDNQVNYIIQKISERLAIDYQAMRSTIYDCIEVLDHYRRFGAETTTPKEDKVKSVSNKVDEILKSDDILKVISNQLEKAGITDTRLGLQLYIASLSRDTQHPLHTIVQAPLLLANQLVEQFVDILPPLQHIELTSISKHALSYSPTQDYWDKKTLVLHKLESINQKGNILLEYLIQGKSLRLVTASNNQTGNYQSQQKNITGSINLISYTDQDYHPVFASKQCLCFPVQQIERIKTKLYEQEIKLLAGLTNQSEQEQARLILQNIPKEIVSYEIHNPIIEQIDLMPFFKQNYTALGQYLKLVNLITLLHQYQNQSHLKIAKPNQVLEVDPKHMIIALELFREVFLKADKELYFNVESTFIRLKKTLKDSYQDDYQDQSFTLNGIRKQLNMSPVTLNRHLKTLEEYGKIVRCGGNNRVGFQYQIIEWGEHKEQTEYYYELLHQLKNVKI